MDAPRRGKELGAADPKGERPPLAACLVPGTKSPDPILVPCLLLRDGNVCIPGDEGPAPARTSSGQPLDLFEVIDRLAETSPRMYLVDLDGIEDGQPQLDYLQELSKTAELWVDGGVRRADQTIDVIVAGARRAVLSSAFLRGPEELKRAWGLSTDIVFEIELKGGRLDGIDPEWEARDAVALAASVRGVGVEDIVLGFRDSAPDWGLVQQVSAGGPTWVGGSFERTDAPRLAQAGAAGGIYHIQEELAAWAREGNQ